MHNNYNKKILVACEYTGAFTNELLSYGFDVVSCDLLDSEGSKSHYKGDVDDLLYSEDWFAVFAFPPCDFLSKAGLHFCDIKRHGLKAWDRIKKRNDAVDFFLKFWFLDVPFIFIENPIGHISANILKPNQIISPHYFGDIYRKDTCVWLKGFKNIEYSKVQNLFSDSTLLSPLVEVFPGTNRNYTWVDKKTKKQRSVMSKIMAKEIIRQLAPQLALKSSFPLMDLPKLSD
ncbi:hypothetical protein SAMN05421847_0481 [Halpernia humi]|uniref:DNA cytosine methyltransferase n=1 Tax=Halpernia humi TaxID=493375 RepID=A0A1H5TJS3_9FLAO|nr:hypothetical protein [Halpernia humi]SEF62428.1 hypothetical protein SAMN05421847_0481 [Halpernia humi]